jgi:hypothetical protein
MITHPNFTTEKSNPSSMRDSSNTIVYEQPRVGISQCLLGAEVRYDGGHKRDVFLTDVLAPFVEWVPVCPEVEAGLGTPREAMHLAGDPDSPRLLTIRTKINHTDVLKDFSQRRVKELRQHDLDGYIFTGNGNFFGCVAGSLSASPSGRGRTPERLPDPRKLYRTNILLSEMENSGPAKTHHPWNHRAIPYTPSCNSIHATNIYC